MASFRVDINPEVLKWARTTAGLTPEEAAGRAHVGVVQLMMWEEGADDPTFAQLRDLARVYRRPLAVLYLPDPPRDFKVPDDFRRLVAGGSLPMSPNLRFELRRIQTQREDYLDLVAMTDEPLPGIPVVLSIDDDPEAAGEAVRRWLDVNLDDQRRERERSLGFWRTRVETRGIFVAQIQGVEMEEMRGCHSVSGRPPSWH